MKEGILNGSQFFLQLMMEGLFANSKMKKAFFANRSKFSSSTDKKGCPASQNSPLHLSTKK